MHFVGRVFLHVRLQLLDVGALLADDHARTRRVDGDAALLVRTLDHDLRHAGRLELVAQVVADLDVFLEQPPEILLAGVPARIPGAVDAEAKTDRINFLTHYAASFCAFLAAGFLDTAFFFALPLGLVSSAFPSSRFSGTTMVIWAKGFWILAPRPRARAMKRFITRFLPTEAS